MPRNNTISLISGILFSILILVNISSCRNQGEKVRHDNELTIFHAGSLAVPMEKISEEFEKINAGVRINLEAAGSVSCVRKISDLNRSCDILALADYALIDRMMIPEFADWGIMFASNELCLAYTGDSKYQDEISLNNWVQLLLDENVRYGRSDPDSDPCGYRTVLSLKLADKYYEHGVDYSRLLEKDRKYIRPKETDLLALLETNTLDYIFIYKSVAVQHELKYIDLPDSINLGNPELSAFYADVSVEIAGSKPGEKMRITGQPMVYGFTIPRVSENPDLAKKFSEFMIAPEGGLDILEKLGQKAVELQLSDASLSDPGLF